MCIRDRCQDADVLAASSASAAVSLGDQAPDAQGQSVYMGLSLIHISEPTRPY